MPRLPIIPNAIGRRPFTLEEARRAGLTLDHLKGRAWRRLGPGVYVLASVPDSPWLQLAAARCRLPEGIAFAGLTSAWLHDLDVSPCSPIEVAVPPELGISARAGLRLHRVPIPDGDLVTRKGLPALRIQRTLADLAVSLPLVEAVVVADQALHAGLLTAAELSAQAAGLRGSRSGRRLRELAELADGAAESPMESRLRLLLVRAGLPRPLLQVELRDPGGAFLGRPDLFYPEARLCIEFDGSTHRHSLVDDNRRQNRLVQAGYRLLRFTSADLLGSPDSILALVGHALGARPVRRRQAGRAA